MKPIAYRLVAALALHANAASALPLMITTKVTMGMDVYFAAGAEALDAEQRERLDHLVRSRAAHPCALEVVVVVGHADAAEVSALHHIGLSNRRAEYVKNLLVRRGLPPNLFYTEGKGVQQPVDLNDARKNRRVEIEAVGDVKPACFPDRPFPSHPVLV